MKIYEYPLKTTDRQEVLMPEGAEILCVQIKNSDPTLWAMVDDTAELVTRVIAMAGTGHELGITAAGDYIGTVQVGWLEWHFFDLEA